MIKSDEVERRHLSALRAVDIIRKKRVGIELSLREIEYFVDGIVSGTVPEYQAAAWLMAVMLRGLTHGETAMLTEAMLHFGTALDLSRIKGPKIDKHSTGGVGDKTSMVVAPLAAAGGLVVPMISARGAGHWGGTLDKLASIAGFNVDLTRGEFLRVVEECGCAISGQTHDIAPADRKLYALRSATATLESPSLICASIMSKKLGEDLNGLVLDVKTGSGALVTSLEDCLQLAELMVDVGRRMHLRVAAVVSDMSQPLGSHIGNALEVREAIEILRDQGRADVRALCLELAGLMFQLAGRVDTLASGKQLAEELIASGAALDKFRKMILLQGGDPRVVDEPDRLPQARFVADLPSPANGFVVDLDCPGLGRCVALLGAGREEMDDRIDHAVGLALHRKIGDPVVAGQPLCSLYYNREDQFRCVTELLAGCFHVAPELPIAPRPLIHATIT